MKRVGWLAVPALLAGCTTGFTVSLSGVPSAPIPEGAVIELHQPITIPPGSTRVWFQSGRPAPGYDWHEPTCSLEVRTLDQNVEQTVEAGSFTVRRIQSLRDQAGLGTPGLQLAAVNVIAALGGGFGNDGYFRIWKGYHFWLESVQQPEVLRMTCKGGYADEWKARSPSLADIRTALGEMASIHVP